MTAYYILFGIPIVIRIIYILGDKRHGLEIPAEQATKQNRKIILAFFILYFIMIAVRRDDIGVDLANYKYMFNRVEGLDYKELTRFKTEYGYSALNKFIGDISNNFQFYLGVVAFITVLPLGILYYRESENALVSIGIFANLSVFNMLFSGLRQSIAIGIGIFAFYCVKNKSPIKFLLCVFFAFLFHRSALILLILYPVYNVKISKNKIFSIALIMAVLFIFRERIFSFLLKYIGEDYDEKYGSVSNTGAYSILILFIIFCVYSFVMIDCEYESELNGLRNIVVLATCLQIFASLNSVAMRFNYYFIPYIPILISKISNHCNEDDKKAADIANYVMIAFFFCYFFYTAYTGADILRIFPYKAFWQEGVLTDL